MQPRGHRGGKGDPPVAVSGPPLTEGHRDQPVATARRAGWSSLLSTSHHSTTLRLVGCGLRSAAARHLENRPILAAGPGKASTARRAHIRPAAIGSAHDGDRPTWLARPTLRSRLTNETPDKRCQGSRSGRDTAAPKVTRRAWPSDRADDGGAGGKIPRRGI